MANVGIYQLTDTWNSGATTFNGIKIDVTDTASAADSKLLDLQIGSVSKFNVGKDGVVASAGLILDPALSAPAYAEGTLFYDNANKTLALYNDETDVTLQIGQESWIRVYNNTGALIQNGSVVYISGDQAGFPQVAKGIATSETTADTVGFATHEIGIAEYGYVTTSGLVRDVNTTGFTAGDSIYLSTTVLGGFQATAPSLPNTEVHLGHVVSVGATGSIFALQRHREADYQEIIGIADGMAFDKADIFVVDAAGLQFEIEKTGGGGDVDFLIDGTRSTLDCTTGAGVGGRARVALTPGADANTPATNYIYVTDAGGTATLAASTSLPTGAFGWVAKVTVPDATTWATTGEYGIQRYTETFNNNSRGALSHQREKLRALGAVYISGGTQTLTINAGATPDSVHLEVGSASVYQLHRQTFPAFTTGPYYYGNGLDIYEGITDLNAALATTDGTAIGNNDRYNLVVWGAVNYETGDCKLFVNLPTAVYGSDSQASADVSATADYSVPDDLRSVAFLISRIALKYTTIGGGTFTEIDTFSLLGTPVGVRSGGSGVVAATEFVDSTFRLLDNTDATKQIAFEASGITTGTTRTLTAPDESGTLALLSDIGATATAETSIYIDAAALFSVGTADTETNAGTNNATDWWNMATGEILYAKTAMPPQWDGGDLEVEFFWGSSAGTATQNVMWGIAAQCAGDDDAWDVAFSATDKTLDDPIINNTDVHVVSVAGVTPSGTPADGDLLFLKIVRETAGATVSADDAQLLGVRIKYQNLLNRNWYSWKLGDESTDATTGVKNTWYAPAAGKLFGVAAGATTATSGGALTLDVHKGGTTIFGTKITIDSGESDTSTAATPAVLTTDPTTFSAGDKFEFEIDSTTAGAAGLHSDLLISWD